jgi:hypothetical protein
MNPKQEKINEMVGILKNHGIEMLVGGCGCCSSPWVKFKYRGEVIFDDAEADFNTEESTHKNASAI